MSKIGILYICTGRYRVFWEAFYRACEKRFCVGHEKHYFVFTDDTAFPREEKVQVVSQEDPGWPGNALKRYAMFSAVIGHLREFDFLFFFNANAVFVSSVGEEILPMEEEGLVVTRHPGFYNRSPKDFPYERDPRSRAYIPEGKGVRYFASGINGGTAAAYVRMIEDLRAAEEEDARKGITAVWHDESHLNRYVLDRPHKVLDPGYCYPQGARLPFEKKILILDKNHYGGHDYMRGLSDVPVFEGSRRPAPWWRRALRKLLGGA